jgi:hypothetical protein
MTITAEIYDETVRLRNLFNSYGMKYNESTGKIFANVLHICPGGFIGYFREDLLAELHVSNGRATPLEIIVNDSQLMALFKDIQPKLEQLTQNEVRVSPISGVN